MECLRCGRKTEEGDVFCTECLADMRRYPVKPGTVVQLPPKNSDFQPVKPPARRKPTPDETIRKLKKRLRRQRLLLALVVLVFVVLAALTWFFPKKEIEQYLPGQNYTSEQSSQTTETE